MAKRFKSIAFDPVQCRLGLTRLKLLLESKRELSERDDILPFFRANEQLAAFLGSYYSDIMPATEIVFEYPIMGNFTADLIVGNRMLGRYCLIEFEDGRPDSIFRQSGRSISEWSPRLEHGFSQIVDWFSLLDDIKKTDVFKKDFGKDHIRFSALLIIGRDSGISEYDRLRMNWRSNKILVDSHSVLCITFDELHREFDMRLKYITGK